LGLVLCCAHEEQCWRKPAGIYLARHAALVKAGHGRLRPAAPGPIQQSYRFHDALLWTTVEPHDPAALRRCDDFVMSARDDESFEKKVRAIATELGRSVERAVKSIDLDEIARQVEMGGERLREVADLTGRWISDRLSEPEAHDAAQARDMESETAARTAPVAGLHPLDVPSDEQGRALSALDSGRWRVEPGTDVLVAGGDEASATDPGGLVGELRARDWIAADGAVTLVGREALKRWSEGSTGAENARPG
jgi:hypothetical protein